MTDRKMKEMAKRLYFYDYSGRYCKICGHDSFENPWIMDYHHRDPKIKDYGISNRIKRGSLETLKEEIDKCDLLCSNCHRSSHRTNELSEYSKHSEEILKRFNDIKNAGGKIEPLRKNLTHKYPKDQIEQMISEGLTKKAIAKELDESIEAVSWMLEKYELRTLTHQRKKKSREQSIIRDYVTYGFSISALANKYSTTMDDISEFLKSSDIKIRTSKRVFSDDDINTIKVSLESGLKVTEISQMLGCHCCTLYKVANRLGLYSFKKK